MKTSNFDLVAELSESLINKAIAIAFYEGFFSFKKKIILKANMLSDSFQDYLEVKIRVDAKQTPYINFNLPDMVELQIPAKVSVIILDGIQFDADIDIYIQSTIIFHKDIHSLKLNITELKIDELSLSHTDFPQKLNNKLNKLLKLAIYEDLLAKYENLEINIPFLSFKLPKMPDNEESKLPVNAGGFKIISQKLVAGAINLFNYNGGNASALTDFTQGANLAVAIREDAIHRIFDFWWEKTTYAKSITKEKVTQIKFLQQFLDFMADVVDIGAKLATLGFLETDYEVKEAWAEYGATLRINKPQFDFEATNIIDLSGSSVVVDVWVKVKAKIESSIEVDTSGIIPDWLTPWEDDITISKKTSTMTLVSLTENNIEATLDKAICRVNLNNDFKFELDIIELDLNLNFGDDWYEKLEAYLLNLIIDLVEESIIEKLEGLVLLPSLIATETPDKRFHISAQIKYLEMTGDEISFGANLDIVELRGGVLPVPCFVANASPNQKEVHFADCKFVSRMNEENKRAYFSLDEAFADGYDACKFCFPKFSKR